MQRAKILVQEGMGGGEDTGLRRCLLGRYIQLPINAGMLEAVLEPWQVIATEAGSRSMSLLKAASELGVGVFASGPLGEGSLLQNKRVQVKPIFLHLASVHEDAKAGIMYCMSILY